MPSKATPEEALKADTNVKILIELIRSATEFKADTSQMAAVCGLTAAKNVYVILLTFELSNSVSHILSPREINSILAPYGLELKGGKIVSKDGSENGKSDKSVDEDKAPPKTPNTPKKNPNAKASTKKRKIDHEDDGIDVDGTKVEESVKGEAVKGEAGIEEPAMEEAVMEEA